MTNKINGIDVSECSYYNKDDEPYCCGIWNNECEAQNCYYKQLKRLEQENKELKEKQIINDIDKLDGMVKIKGKCGYEFIGGCRELKKYKQALEEIREKCLKMCNICDNIDGETYLDDCNLICEYCKIVKLINEVLNDRN